MFYNSKRATRGRRTRELLTRKTKDRLCSQERKFTQQTDKSSRPVMLIGNRGTGVGSSIKGYSRRGGKWISETHGRYAVAAITDEHMTSQLCIYCFAPIVHPSDQDGNVILGTSRCINYNCPAFKQGRATNNRDKMSAAAIGISGMAKLLLNKDYPPFTSKHQH
jgi:hypothetical protein